jgi:hypothetical protein
MGAEGKRQTKFNLKIRVLVLPRQRCRERARRNTAPVGLSPPAVKDRLAVPQTGGANPAKSRMRLCMTMDLLGNPGFESDACNRLIIRPRCPIKADVAPDGRLTGDRWGARGRAPLVRAIVVEDAVLFERGVRCSASQFTDALALSLRCRPVGIDSDLQIPGIGPNLQTVGIEANWNNRTGVSR